MKLNKILNLFIASIVLFLTACEPVVDEKELSNNTTVEGVELVALQSTAGGNGITLKMNTPGVTGYWDFNLGRAFTDRVSFVYPIPGTATFTFTGTLGAEFFEKTIQVQIDVLDQPLEQDYYDLVGEDTTAGKNWVFDGGPSPDGRRWWYMSPPDDPNGWATAWWNAGGDCCPPSDAAAVMHFDLNGAANYVKTNGGDSQAGSFALDVENQTLSFVGVPSLGGVDCRENAEQIYQIISLTEDELILYTARTACGDSGWTYIYKPQ